MAISHAPHMIAGTIVTPTMRCATWIIMVFHSPSGSSDVVVVIS